MRACSRPCARFRANEFVPDGVKAAGVRRHGATHRRRSDDQPALHRRAHDRARRRSDRTRKVARGGDRASGYQAAVLGGKWPRGRLLDRDRSKPLARKRAEATLRRLGLRARPTCVTATATRGWPESCAVSTPSLVTAAPDTVPAPAPRSKLAPGRPPGDSPGRNRGRAAARGSIGEPGKGSRVERVAPVQFVPMDGGGAAGAVRRTFPCHRGRQTADQPPFGISAHAPMHLLFGDVLDDGRQDGHLLPPDRPCTVAACGIRRN